MIRRRPSGFLFTELLVAIGLLSVAMLVAMRVSSGSITSIIAARENEDRQLAVDNMTTALRHDAWSAKSAEAPDANTIILSTSNGQKICWHFESSTATRTVDRETHWIIPEAKPSLDRVSISLQSKDSQWRFIIPTLLSEGGAK